MKKFLKSGSIELINGGYVSTVEGKNPVTNQEFIDAQKHAEYVCTFAALAKGKDFKGKKADSLADLEQEVQKTLATKSKKFIDEPVAVSQEITEKLKKEAMSFMTYQKDKSNADKINEFMQAFNVIAEFEEFGLFFEDGIVKLNKIYTIEEILNAVKSTINLIKQ